MIAVRPMLAVTLAFSVLLASTGLTLIPLRTQPAAVDGRVWFPCIDHGCGCLNAQMCLTSCCCAKPALAAPKVNKAAPAAGGSCCSGGKSTAPACPTTESRPTVDESTVGVRLAVRSAQCSGRNLLLGFFAVSWLCQTSPPVALTRPIEQATVIDAPVPDAIGLAVDPPPPRPA